MGKRASKEFLKSNRNLDYNIIFDIYFETSYIDNWKMLFNIATQLLQI